MIQNINTSLNRVQISWSSAEPSFLIVIDTTLGIIAWHRLHKHKDLLDIESQPNIDYSDQAGKTDYQQKTYIVGF